MRRREGEEEVSNQREDEEAEGEAEREGKEGEEEKEKKVVVSEKELMVPEGEEEEQVKLESRLGAEEAQEVQMEDGKIEDSKETMADKQEDKETKGLEERDEKKRSRKKRGKKQSERVRNRRSLKDVGERFEEEKRSEIQEVVCSEESLAVSEPPIGLMNNCDLSDPLYLGFGGTGLYCPPVPVPLLYSSQPPVPIQPAPPQLHGTKRPQSPPLPQSLPQQSTQPLKVRIDCYCLTHTYFSAFLPCNRALNSCNMVTLKLGS